nr:histidine--tRNA ligase, cytoplasmic [Tanacetum cinerariifolium]
MAEIWDIKFNNDGKSMLLTTKSNNIYVLDAYNGEKCRYFSNIADDESKGADYVVAKVLTELLDELNIGEYEIDEKGLDTEPVDKIVSFVKLRGHPLEFLQELKKEGSPFLTSDSSKQALNELDKLFQALDSARCVYKVVFYLSLARGLDYYIGCIYATGGRYDDLIGTIGSKPIAAIGVSLGIERVFIIIKENQKNDKPLLRASETQVLVSISGDDLNVTAKLMSDKEIKKE